VSYNITVEIRASPQIVWDVLLDIERWPEWTPSVTSIQRLDEGPFRVGSLARICQPKLPPADWQVTELERWNFTWVTGRPGVRVTARHHIEPQPAGSRATLSLEFAGLPGKLVGRLMRRLNERYLRLEAEGLKSRSEDVQQSMVHSRRQG